MFPKGFPKITITVEGEQITLVLGHFLLYRILTIVSVLTALTSLDIIQLLTIEVLDMT